MLRLQKIHKILLRKQITVASVKWFYTIVEIKLRLQYEPENLDVNKVCFDKQLDIPCTHEKTRFKAVEYFDFFSENLPLQPDSKFLIGPVKQGLFENNVKGKRMIKTKKIVNFGGAWNSCH